jgi:hypothetical protein
MSEAPARGRPRTLIVSLRGVLRPAFAGRVLAQRRLRDSLGLIVGWAVVAGLGICTTMAMEPGLRDIALDLKDLKPLHAVAVLFAHGVALDTDVWIMSLFLLHISVPSTAIGVALLGILMFPAVHRAGNLWPAVARCLAVAATTAPAAAVLITTQGLVVAAEAMIGLLMNVPSEMPGAVLWTPLAVLLILHLCAAARGAGSTAPAVPLPPRCEGCGYDLTHRPAERCSECGANVAESLSPLRRGQSDWDRGERTWRAWLGASWSALLSPGRFYAALRTRGSSSPARRFSGLHLLWLAIGGGCWISAMWTLSAAFPMRQPSWLAAEQALLGIAMTIGAGLACGARPASRRPNIVLALLILGLAILVAVNTWSRDFEMILILLGFTFATPVVTWFGLRLAGLVVGLACALTHWLADLRCLERVLAYESVVLWLFCGMWGSMLASFVAMGPWLSIVLAKTPLRNAAEPMTVLLLTLGGAAAWIFVRLPLALRRVRWANG